MTLYYTNIKYSNKKMWEFKNKFIKAILQNQYAESCDISIH